MFIPKHLKSYIMLKIQGMYGALNVFKDWAIARLKSEKQTPENLERIQSILALALDAVISINQDGIVDVWNEQAEKTFGWSNEEAIGKKLVELIIPSMYREAHLQGVRKFLMGGSSNILGKRLELKAINKQGQIFPVELTVSVQKILNRHYFTAFIRDLRDRKAAEKELCLYTQDLKRSNQDLDDFAYIASHDLKEPLRGILTQVFFLLEDYEDKLDEEGIRKLRRLVYLGQRMEKLITDLLHFSQLGRAGLAVEETDINKLVVEVLEMMDTFLEERNAKVTIPLPMPRTVCDKLRIGEVFRNLITNAIKYNDKPERLVEVGYLENIKAPHGDERDVFYVKDNGVGIEPEFYQVIFRIFKRLQNPAVKNEEGTGAGLTFVKKIVERHNGHIWLESVPGKGSTFYFTMGKLSGENV